MICSFSQQNVNSVLLLMTKAFIGVVTNFTQNMQNGYKWFVYWSIKGNLDKFQFIMLGNTDSHTLQISDIFTKCVSFVRVLGITIDSKLNLKAYQQYYKKAYYKLYALRL